MRNNERYTWCRRGMSPKLCAIKRDVSMEPDGDIMFRRNQGTAEDRSFNVRLMTSDTSLLKYQNTLFAMVTERTIAFHEHSTLFFFFIPSIRFVVKNTTFQSLRTTPLPICSWNGTVRSSLVTKPTRNLANTQVRYARSGDHNYNERTLSFSSFSSSAYVHTRMLKSWKVG